MKNRSDILFFVLVFLLQVIITDYLHLGPWVFICLLPLLILHIPLSHSPHRVMLTAFALGLLLDVLSDGVVGLNAFAAVLAAAPRKFLYRALVNGDRQDKTGVPSLSEAGIVKYLKYLSVITAIYLAGYMLLDCAGSRPLLFILGKFLASTLASTAAGLLLAWSIQKRN